MGRGLGLIKEMTPEERQIYICGFDGLVKVMTGKYGLVDPVFIGQAESIKSRLDGYKPITDMYVLGWLFGEHNVTEQGLHARFDALKISKLIGMSRVGHVFRKRGSVESFALILNLESFVKEVQDSSNDAKFRRGYGNECFSFWKKGESEDFYLGIGNKAVLRRFGIPFHVLMIDFILARCESPNVKAYGSDFILFAGEDQREMCASFLSYCSRAGIDLCENFPWFRNGQSGPDSIVRVYAAIRKNPKNLRGRPLCDWLTAYREELLHLQKEGCYAGPNAKKEREHCYQ